jgi:invasion protein IalB
MRFPAFRSPFPCWYFAGAAAALVFSTLTPPAQAQGAAQPGLLQQYGDWGVYVGANGSAKVCFAMSQPTSAVTDPPNRPRDPIYLYITTRPAENVRNEVSIIVGYPLKPNSDATAEIGSTKFIMQTQADNAWLKNPAEEAAMVDAMRRGSDLVVKGVSGRGTQTTDRYSLKGISQALDRVGQECR